jgi:hypothetical protein
MGDRILGAWFELQLVALMVSFGAGRWLARQGDSSLGKSALASAIRGRQEMLRETCRASDAAWARLVRCALRQGTRGGKSLTESYRIAPDPTPDRALVRCYRQERGRLRSGVLVGMGGALVALAVSALLLRTPGFFPHGALSGGLTIWMAARVVVSGARSLRELRVAFDMLPRLLQACDGGPPPRLRATSGPVAWLDPSSIWVGLLILMPALFVAFALLTMVLGTLDPGKAMRLLFTHSLLVVLLLGLRLLSHAHVALDVLRGELVLSRSLFGLTIERMVLPVEIIRSFFATPGTRARGASPVALLADVGEPLKLLIHQDAPRVAASLNETLASLRAAG